MNERINKPVGKRRVPESRLIPTRGGAPLIGNNMTVDVLERAARSLYLHVEGADQWDDLTAYKRAQWRALVQVPLEAVWGSIPFTVLPAMPFMVYRTEDGSVGDIQEDVAAVIARHGTPLRLFTPREVHAAALIYMDKVVVVAHDKQARHEVCMSDEWSVESIKL